jgi:hypothetical protein
MTLDVREFMFSGQTNAWAAALKESKGKGVQLLNPESQKGGYNETDNLNLVIGNGSDSG